MTGPTYDVVCSICGAGAGRQCWVEELPVPIAMTIEGRLPLYAEPAAPRERTVRDAPHPERVVLGAKVKAFALNNRSGA